MTAKNSHPEMVYISFPGDEKSSGGCVAAGRGFFHINSHGGLLDDDHEGGCVLYEKRSQVEALLNK